MQLVQPAEQLVVPILESLLHRPFKHVEMGVHRLQLLDPFHAIKIKGRKCVELILQSLRRFPAIRYRSRLLRI